MDKNVTVPDSDPSSDGDETGKGEVEWDNVSADVMRRITWKKPRYLQHFDPVSVTIIIRVPINGGETSVTSHHVCSRGTVEAGAAIESSLVMTVHTSFGAACRRHATMNPLQSLVCLTHVHLHTRR